MIFYSCIKLYLVYLILNVWISLVKLFAYCSILFPYNIQYALHTFVMLQLERDCMAKPFSYIWFIIFKWSHNITLQKSQVWMIGNTYAIFFRSMLDRLIYHSPLDYRFKQWAISIEALLIRIVFVSRETFVNVFFLLVGE